MTRSIRNAKLTAQEVLRIRAEAKGWKGRSADFVRREADRFGVGIETIRKVLRGETFRHLEAEVGEVEGASKPSLTDEAVAASASASAARLAAALGEGESPLSAVGKLQAALAARKEEGDGR